MGVKGFFGMLLMIVGGLVALLAGGCGIIFEIGFMVQTRTGDNYLGSLGTAILPLIFGGIPALFGFGLYKLGKWLKKRAARNDAAV